MNSGNSTPGDRTGRAAAPRQALVLVPGLLCNQRLWRAQAAGLADVADVLVADMSRDGSMAAMAARVLAEAPERFALAGLSMGGYVAMEVVRRAPERVTRLALLDTSARADPPEAAARRRDMVDLVRRGRFRAVNERLLRSFVHEDRLGDGILVAEILAMTAEVGQEAFVRQQQAILGRRDSRPHLAAVSCDTLVLCGREDGLTPLGLSEEIAALVPGARLAVIEACGHLSPMERPLEVNAELRAWLGAGPPPQTSR